MGDMEMFQKLTRSGSCRLVVLGNECVNLNGASLLGVCWIHGLPFATPCQPTPGNNRPTEYERSVFAAGRAQRRWTDASDVRVSRLLQIKQELSKMRDCPPEPRVWWD